MSCLTSPLSVCYLAVLTLLHFFLTLPQEYMKLDLQLPFTPLSPRQTFWKTCFHLRLNLMKSYASFPLSLLCLFVVE